MIAAFMLVTGAGVTAAAPTPISWHTVDGVDALGADTRGLIGKKDSYTDCANSCTKASIWVWSSSSKNCYCKEDAVWVDEKRAGIWSGCVEAGPACVPGCGTCARPQPAPAPPSPWTPPSQPFTPSREPNMNGRYQLTETATSNTSKFPDYRDYPGGAQYFDVYSPLISQLYSQVYWSALPPVKLPDAVVKAFAGRTMAFLGFEMDQVQNPTVPVGGGSSAPGSVDLSVPINVVVSVFCPAVSQLWRNSGTLSDP